jgi:hypothetical protein
VERMRPAEVPKAGLHAVELLEADFRDLSRCRSSFSVAHAACRGTGAQVHPAPTQP